MKSALKNKEEKLKDHDNLFWAYLAGMMDANGCIMITKLKDPKASRGFSWQVNVRVGCKNGSYLEGLKESIGGCISKSGNSHQWRIGGNTARVVLSKVFPYLIIKQKQCVWAIKALELTRGHRKRGFDSIRTDKCLNTLCLKISTFNQKGI